MENIAQKKKMYQVRDFSKACYLPSCYCMSQ